MQIFSSINSVSVFVDYFQYIFFIDPPNIIRQVMDHTQNEGQIASFTCQADGEPDANISWYFNDVPLDVTNTMKYDVVFSIIMTGTQSVIRINNVQSSDVGTYTCNATNVLLTVTSSGILSVVNGKSAF